MKRHLLINWAGMNSGDDYLCEFIVSRLRAFHKVETLRMMSESPVPAVEKEILDSNWYALFTALDSFGNFARVCTELRGADRILLGGGDVLRPEFLSMLPLLLGVVLNRKISLVGVGVVAPHNFVWALIYRIALRGVDVALVRDERSMKLLRQFCSAPVRKAPDLVFAAANAVAPVVCQSRVRDSIVINLRSVSNRAYLSHLKIESLDDGLLCDALASALCASELVSTSRVILLPMVDDSAMEHGYADSESDLQILKKLRDRLPSWVTLDVMPHRPYSIQDLAAIYGAAKVVIAMRLHAVIPAIAWGVPVVALPYASKVNDLRERFPELQTIPIEDLLNGDVSRNCRTIDVASNAVSDTAIARSVGEEAERALDFVMDEAKATATNASKLLITRGVLKLAALIFVSLFVLKAGLNRTAVRRRKTLGVA
ncbi:polysaccharide pyruvyl transferase family protein [Paraburkholderia dipogonis]|uniref:Polysaccharide pyruvyl transferase family protein n=1 Tax=Paraburkholderia dipogonis TaxID=1211383 RepID=A0A4Y8MG46_9BURK|nr:polysaccharide pyruvyl transferase family protein [Paraburkholderia dipogonis]TFE36407.1 polysaccharide pyruvyl transferase family protein [Paraburkholderia dipogonis]